MAKITDTGLDFVRGEEGEVLQMYRDSAGLPTIGIGHLLTKDELRSGKLTCLGIEWINGISSDQAEDLLRRDLAVAEAVVTQEVTAPLTAQQFDSLVSFAYNVGATAFKNSTLLKRLNLGLYDEVPKQMRRWIHSGGRVDPILVKRREREIALWKSSP